MNPNFVAIRVIVNPNETNRDALDRVARKLPKSMTIPFPVGIPPEKDVYPALLPTVDIKVGTNAWLLKFERR